MALPHPSEPAPSGCTPVIPAPAAEAWLDLALAAGGDERLWRDPATGRNRYGVPAGMAGDEIWFSSSTASALSPRGRSAAAAALASLAEGTATPADLVDAIRARLKALYGAPGGEVVLSASGTDVEGLALGLVLAIRPGALTSIVIAPTEAGSGVPLAADGRFFLSSGALEPCVPLGERLPGLAAADIRVRNIAIREADGTPRAAATVDAEAEDQARHALADGRSVLLHVLDCSKTGLAGVTRAAARRIRALDPARVRVLVDACQLRCASAQLRADLADGFAVAVTGSKFAGGPAFCGALLIPDAWVTELGATPALPAGLSTASARLDWPARWRGAVAATLRAPFNLGLALRWSAALAEIGAYEALCPERRAEALGAFARAVAARASRIEGLTGLAAPGAGSIHVLALDAPPAALADAWRAMASPAADGPACHLGQPVAVGERAVLRICASMPLVTDIALRLQAGEPLAAATAPVEADLDHALTRLDQALRPHRPAPADASLDPADWDAFAADAHAALDRAIARIRGVREGPVWRAPSAEAVAAFQAPIPAGPRPFAEVLDDVDRWIAPFTPGNTHPLFMGWVHGAGTPYGMVAEMLAAGLNANCGGRNHVGPMVERQITAWMAGAFGFPADASGLLVTGASQANLIGVLVARDKALGQGVRRDGLHGSRRLTAYASAEAHGCVAKAMDLAGLGSAQLRRIAADAGGAMRLDALEAAIAADRAAGLAPFLVVGTAGTVNIGGFDDLAAVGEIARREGLWFHVDGAFGALATFSPRLRGRLAGLDGAHSVAFDFHKWAHVPYDAGFILVRDAADHRAAFANPADYLSREPRGLAAGETWPCDLGPDLSRGFRALKVWMTLQAVGTDALGAAMEANCRAAEHLATRLRGSERFELAAPVGLNIVCFGVRGDATGDTSRALVMALHEAGLAAPSTTMRDGRWVVRAAIFNHRTTLADIDRFVDALETTLDGL
ncbi:pyridoxal phosphate-dependent decarboxylase family protein [Caulobacter sp. KR2-114]|uniref:pyridoxal phosphate-dependent decarboxylase family protein n=1 Tax=Caulobacter sp. KR2-114 TaxID=3400912 RepID=UPI003C09ECA8